MKYIKYILNTINILQFKIDTMKQNILNIAIPKGKTY